MRDAPVVRSVPSKKQNALPGHLGPEKASECWGAIARGRLLLPPLKDELVTFGGVLPHNVQDPPRGSSPIFGSFTLLERAPSIPYWIRVSSAGPEPPIILESRGNGLYVDKVRATIPAEGVSDLLTALTAPKGSASP